MKLRDLLRLSLMLAMVVAGRFARDAERTAQTPPLKSMLAIPTAHAATPRVITTASPTAALSRVINYN